MTWLIDKAPGWMRVYGDWRIEVLSYIDWLHWYYVSDGEVYVVVLALHGQERGWLLEVIHHPSYKLLMALHRLEENWNHDWKPRDDFRVRKSLDVPSFWIRQGLPELKVGIPGKYLNHEM